MGHSGISKIVLFSKNCHFHTSLTFTLTTLVSWIIWTVKGYSEFCIENTLIQISHSDCPHGVVFNDPVTASCVYPNPDDRAHLSDLCRDYNFDPNVKKIQFVDTGSDDSQSPTSDHYGSRCNSACGNPLVLNVQNTIGEETSCGDDEDSDTPEDPDPEQREATLNQTMRMFMYMTDHLIDENPQGPDIRLVELLKLSFDILRAHCHSNFVTHEFSLDIEKAFLYLLRESDTGRIKDVSLQEYKNIKRVLNRCATQQVKPFSFQGTQCKPLSKVTHIVKMAKRSRGQEVNDTSVPYTPSHLSYKCGKYDFPVDATWGTVDFTHGLCYGVFNLDPNSHHLYQQAMEQLFTKEVRYRWEHPPKLKQHYYWDHIFRSKVKTSMHNLDACIQATYMGSPFLHRLRRPWITKEDVEAQSKNQNQNRRRKRSIGSNAWCLQSVEEKDTIHANLCGS